MHCGPVPICVMKNIDISYIFAYGCLQPDFFSSTWFIILTSVNRTTNSVQDLDGIFAPLQPLTHSAALQGRMPFISSSLYRGNRKLWMICLFNHAGRGGFFQTSVLLLRWENLSEYSRHVRRINRSRRAISAFSRPLTTAPPPLTPPSHPLSQC